MNYNVIRQVRFFYWIPVLLLFKAGIVTGQPDSTAPPITFDVNAIKWGLSPVKGDGGMVNEYSWDFATNTSNVDFEFWCPSDWWYSNMLYQIFSPICLSDSGLVDTSGVRHPRFADYPYTSQAVTDWTWERRRYRPPNIVVDGAQLNPPYQWQVDHTLNADEVGEFDDLIPAYGMRAHVTIYAFSNPELSNIAIWKITLKFTGETALPRQGPRFKHLPDQTIQMWWPFSMSFGPTIGGKYMVYSSYGFESEDVLDSWFERPAGFQTSDPRKNLYVGYYWDYYNYTTAGTPKYPNGSIDNSGDPDRDDGHLYSTQVPGYALLYAPASASNAVDDTTQPFSMPHATIVGDLWGRRDAGLRDTYIGTDSRGKFPPDAITAGFSRVPQKGPMRFITVGPYYLTKNAAQGRYDSLTFVYAIAAGTVPWSVADSVGKAWFKGQITDAQKDSLIKRAGKDSLFSAVDRAYWAWRRIASGKPVPAVPAPPDIDVTSGPDRITVNWSYPDPSYFKNAVTGVDDWYAWRVYRKEGAFYVGDPLDKGSGAQWKLVYETHDRNQATYVDTNVVRGVDYYYAVTAVNNGTQNDGIYPGQPIEGSRYATMTLAPAAAFRPGLSIAGQVRVVPNPATRGAGALGFSGTPDKILFVNLPVKCTLSIYTETGDLVTKWDHYGTADDTWNQRTEGNQYVASGIYILAVTNSEGLSGNKLPDQFVKFIIVR